MKRFMNVLKKIREWGFFFLALGTFTMGIFTIILYVQTNPSTKPDLDIDLLDQTVLHAGTLAQIWHTDEGDFGVKESHLFFKITNLGMKDTGFLNIDIKDTKEEYEFNSFHIKELESLDHELFHTFFQSKDCKGIYYEAKRNNETWKIASDKCKQVKENLELGKRKLFLKVDCPGCEFNNKKFQCYSFVVCIYESNKKSCGEDSSYYSLEEENCPKDWIF